MQQTMKQGGKKTAIRVIGVVLTILLVLILCFLIGARALFGEFLIAAETVEKREEGLYSLEYRGDYGFDEFLAGGGASSDAEVADYLTQFLSRGFYRAESAVETEAFGCSTLAVKDENGSVLFGRNYDWAECEAMIVHTVPKNGYESVSTCCLNFLGFGDDFAPDRGLMERLLSIASIYVPLDGMNEKGLIVADLLAGDRESTQQQTDKTDLTTTTAIRLLLDRAATVDEAIELLQGVDMHSSVDSAHHFSIADRSGKSVVVEYIGGVMSVTETKIVTNHYLTEGERYGVGSAQSHSRFTALQEAWRQANGVMSETALAEAMSSVAQYRYPQTEGDYEKTMWTILYDAEACQARFFYREDYTRSYTLTLGSDAWCIE